jgi:hypothetical protein
MIGEWGGFTRNAGGRAMAIAERIVVGHTALVMLGGLRARSRTKSWSRAGSEDVFPFAFLLSHG